ncbi:MAG: hypothetical protein WKF97_13150 [Chitinophagaceae bacterium]
MNSILNTPIGFQEKLTLFVILKDLLNPPKGVLARTDKVTKPPTTLAPIHALQPRKLGVQNSIAANYQNR